MLKLRDCSNCALVGTAKNGINTIVQKTILLIVTSYLQNYNMKCTTLYKI